MKIYLFCNLGMSTSILVDEILEKSKTRGMDMEVEAFPISELKKHVENIDVALLGPQVGYRLKEAKEICQPHHVPVGVVPMQAYGLCDGEAVLNFAMQLLEEEQ